MTGKRVLDAPLIEAYKQTHYKVNSDHGAFTLKIGIFSAELDALQRSHSVSGSAFITAWNPYGEPLNAADNQTAHARLVAELTEAGFYFMPGIGEDPSGAWTGEESVLIVGIDESKAIDLGARYRQNAIVYADCSAVPALLYPTFGEAH